MIIIVGGVFALAWMIWPFSLVLAVPVEVRWSAAGNVALAVAFMIAFWVVVSDRLWTWVVGRWLRQRHRHGGSGAAPPHPTVAACPHGLAVHGQWVEWRQVERFAVLKVSRRRAEVAAVFAHGVDTGMPQVARMVSRPWVPTDERLRWLGGVAGRDLALLTSQVEAWTGRPSVILEPSA